VRQTQSNFYKKDTKIKPSISNTYKSSVGVPDREKKTSPLVYKADSQDEDEEADQHKQFEGHCLQKRVESNMSYIEGVSSVKHDTFLNLNEERERMAKTFN